MIAPFSLVERNGQGDITRVQPVGPLVGVGLPEHWNDGVSRFFRSPVPGMPARVGEWLQEAADEYNVSVAAILGPSKEHKFLRPRWSVIRRLHDAGYTMSQIARWMKRTPSAVNNGLRNGSGLQ